METVPQAVNLQVIESHFPSIAKMMAEDPARSITVVKADKDQEQKAPQISASEQTSDLKTNPPPNEAEDLDTSLEFLVLSQLQNWKQEKRADQGQDVASDSTKKRKPGQAPASPVSSAKQEKKNAKLKTSKENSPSSPSSAQEEDEEKPIENPNTEEDQGTLAPRGSSSYFYSVNKMSFQEAAVRVLLKQRSEGVQALSTRRIWDLIQQDGLIDTKCRTPVSSLSSRITEDVRTKGHKSVFVRVADGLYALRDGIQWDVVEAFLKEHHPQLAASESAKKAEVQSKAVTRNATKSKRSKKSREDDDDDDQENKDSEDEGEGEGSQEDEDESFSKRTRKDTSSPSRPRRGSRRQAAKGKGNK